MGISNSSRVNVQHADKDASVDQNSLDDLPPPYDSDAEDTSTSKRPVVDSLRAQLAEMGLSTLGRRSELQKRLRAVKKRQRENQREPPPFSETFLSDQLQDGWGMPIDEATRAEWVSVEGPDDALDEKRPDGVQPYTYYCVIDVEGTCEKDADWDFPNEIIEFPVVLIDGQSTKIIDEFHEFVRPIMNPTLSQFCTQLTGITQDVVDAAEAFPIVLSKFEGWLTKYSRYPFRNVCFMCDGPWDIRDFIRKQCEHSIMDRPPYFMRFVDLRRYYVDYYNRERTNLSGMLNALGMRFEGREHSGLDDARNIARIVVQMMKDGCIFVWNRELKLSKRKIGKQGRILYTKASNSTAKWTDGTDIVL